jgi:hypothetical protein
MILVVVVRAAALVRGIVIWLPRHAMAGHLGRDPDCAKRELATTIASIPTL